MKAVILEIKGGKAAVLSEDGRISRISNKNYTIGQQIIMRNNSYVKLAATAAAAVLLFATPAWAYLTPYSYVSLDVNPSFEFSINRFDRVIEVKAVNADAEPIVEEISIEGLKNKEIKEAVKAVLTELKDRGYIAEGEDGGVVVATSSKSEEKNNKLAEALKATVNGEVKIKENKGSEESVKTENTEKSDKTDKPENNGNGPKKDFSGEPAEYEETEEPEKIEEPVGAKGSKEDKGVEVEVVKVTQQKVNEAKEKGVTPGKMNLVDKLEEVSGKEDFNEDEWLKKPVKEIMDATKEYEKAAKEENKEIKEQEKEKSNSDSKTESKENSSGTDSSKGNKKN